MELMNDPISKITGHLGAIVRAVDLCLGEKLILPTLMLIYSGIDALAALEKHQDEGTKRSFVRWADRYLAPKMTCSGIDLYGARCGIVHSLSASSDLSRDRKARLVIYAWGTSKAEDLEAIAEALEWKNQVVIHISDLRDSFAEAIGEYFEDVATDEARVAMVTKNAGKEWLSHVPGEVVDILIGRESNGT